MSVWVCVCLFVFGHVCVCVWLFVLLVVFFVHAFQRCVLLLLPLLL